MPNSFEGAPRNESAEASPVEIYRQTAITRINELVADGTYPQHYADDLIQSVLLIEEGITDPERDGIKFAELGVVQIRAFREGINAAEIQTVQMCNDVLEQIDDLWQQVKSRKVVPINILELTQAVEATKQNIEYSLAEFQAKLEEVRNLQAGLASLADMGNLEDTLEELKRFLEESAND